MRTKTQFTNRMLSLVLSIMMVVSMLPINVLTANAAEGDATSTYITGEAPDSDDSEFTHISWSASGSDTSAAGTSWSDKVGKGNLIFRWGNGEKLDVALLDFERIITHETPDIQIREDAHIMDFSLSSAYEDGTRIIAVRGFDNYNYNEYLATGIDSVANIFTQTASGDPGFLSGDMLMYSEAEITNGTASVEFKHIPAAFRFIITNTHGKALSLESVTIRVVDVDGTPVATASNACNIEIEAENGYPELFYRNDVYSTYDAVTTNITGGTLEPGQSYLAYALALPVGNVDTGKHDEAAFKNKTIQVTVTTSEGACIAFELVADDLAAANPNNEYNWCGGKSYTIHMETRCAGGCTLDAAGNCTVCGYQCDHDYDNGFCTLCDTYQPATLNVDSYYEIDNAGKLFWFAQQVNVKGNRELKGVLTADIDLENKPWTPIGETGEDNNNFRGVFDGQGHTIKGLYVEGSKNGVGFFGEVRTGTVKNFTIYGEVVVNTEVDYVGGVIGSICGVNGETDLERNGTVIQNITSFVNVTAKAHGIGMIGGFVGYANHQSLIEQCAWYGTFDADEYRVDFGAGGFIGKIQENTSEVTIRNCGAYGTIKTNYAGDYNNNATIYMGGFLSFSNTDAKTTLENCLFAGRFERGENLTDQAFLGAFGTLRSVNAIKNCYYLGDDGLAAVHSDSPLKPGSDNVEITKVTGEELRNNTIATQLGDLWEQGVHYPIFKEGQTWHGDSATYTYTDNGDGTHDKVCDECGYEETSRPHTIIDHVCVCGAKLMHIDKVTVAGWVEAEEIINAGWAVEVTEEALELLSSDSPEIIPEGELHGSADQHQCIGISVTNENNQPLYQADNDAWYHDGNGWFSDTTAPICNSNSVVSAYYPYFSLDSYLIPWHIDECELLYGTATDSTESLTLERRQARLMLTPTFGSELPDNVEIREIEISGIYTEGTFNGKTGILTPGGNPDGAILLKDNGDGTWETGLIPMDAKTVTLTIRTNEDKYYITTVELPSVEAGKQYDMTVQVGADILDLEYVGDPHRWSYEQNLLGYTEIPAAPSKTEWANGDTITLILKDENGELNYKPTITYQDGMWSFDGKLYDYSDTDYESTAIYAANGEYAEGKISISRGVVNVDFNNPDYSRLRILGTANTTYNIDVTGFTPADGSEAPESYTLTTDADGNAFLYGTFGYGATVKVRLGDETVADYTFESGTDSGHSYVLCVNHSGGTATCTNQAVCEICGESYGELDSNNHASENYTYTDNGDGTHDKVCSVCGYVENASETHSHVYTANETTDTIAHICICGDVEMSFTLNIPTAAYGDSPMAVPHFTCSDTTYAGEFPVITIDGEENNFPTNAGTYEVIMTWSEVSVSGEYVVKKAETSVLTAPIGNTMIYNGEAQELITAGTAKGGTMLYALSEDGDYTTEIPTATNAGDYTVWYYVQGDENHIDSPKVSVAAEIVKAKITAMTPPEDMTLTGYFTNAEDIIAILPTTIEIESEDDTSELPIEWTFAGEFDVASNGENTFTWTADIGDLDANGFAVFGEITVTNVEYVVINEENFPDEIFRNYVNENFDTTDDDVLTAEEIAAVTMIRVSNEGIADLTGIEYFTKLSYLDCSSNQLKFLDVSKNTKLGYLGCSYNQIERLDVSNNANLLQLNCNSNQLTTLDIDSCTEIDTLLCAENLLTALDVSNHKELLYLACSYNQLTSLNVIGCTALNNLYCDTNQLTSLDVSNNTALIDLDCSKNKLTSLDVSNNANLLQLNCNNNQLTTLDIDSCTEMDTLLCTENLLTALDVSNHKELSYLACSYNQLTSLNVIGCTALNNLYCGTNQLISLDVSTNTALTDLNCASNQLTSLDVSNNTALIDLYCEENIFTIELIEGKFDLSTMPEGFDITKVSEWHNGTVNGTILSIIGSAENITYTYTLGNGETAIFTLKCKGQIYDIADAEIVFDNTLTYNGEEQKQIVIVYYDGIRLSSVHCKISGNRGTDAGNYTLTIEGLVDFYGTKTVNWTIAKATPEAVPIISKDEYFVGDALPEIGYESKISGIIEWLTELVNGLVEGENVLEWQFTPDDADNYEVVTGTAVVEAQTTTTTTTTTTTSTTTETTTSSTTTSTTTETTTSSTTTSTTTETTTSSTTTSTTTETTTSSTTTSTTTETTTTSTITSTTTETTTSSTTTSSTTTSSTITSTTTETTTSNTSTSTTTETTTTTSTTTSRTTETTTSSTTTSTTTETTTSSTSTFTTTETTTSSTTTSTTTKTTTSSTSTSTTTETTTSSTTTSTTAETTTSSTTTSTTTETTTSSTTTSTTTETTTSSTTTSTTTETTTSSTTTSTTTVTTSSSTTTSTTTETTTSSTTTSTTTETTTTSTTTSTTTETTTSSTTTSTTTETTTSSTSTSATTETTTSSTSTSTTTETTTSSTTASTTTETTSSSTSASTTTETTTSSTSTSTTTETTTSSTTTSTTTTETTSSTTTSTTTETTTSSTTTSTTTETTTSSTTTSTTTTETTSSTTTSTTTETTSSSTTTSTTTETTTSSTTTSTTETTTSSTTTSTTTITTSSSTTTSTTTETTTSSTSTSTTTETTTSSTTTSTTTETTTSSTITSTTTETTTSSTTTTLPQTGYSVFYNYIMLAAAAMMIFGIYAMAKSRKRDEE